MNGLDLIESNKYYTRNELAEIFRVSLTHLVRNLRDNNVREENVKGNDKTKYIQGVSIIGCFLKNPTFLDKKKFCKKKYGIEELPKIKESKKQAQQKDQPNMELPFDENNKALEILGHNGAEIWYNAYMESFGRDIKIIKDKLVILESKIDILIDLWK